MFNNHTMSVVQELSMLGPQIRDSDFLTIAAITTNDYPPLPNIHYAGILIPPTEILMRWADGDQFILQSEYPKYLSSKDCDDMIIALIAALTKRNVVLYIPKDEFDVFGLMLLSHIYYMYGIVMNSPTTQFSIDQSKLPFIMAKFYMMDIMDPQVFLDIYPPNYPIPDFCIDKLAAEIRPFNRPATFEEYRDYFNNLNALKMEKQNKILMTRSVDKK